MSYDPIVDEVAIASTAISLLERDVMLAGTIWRDPVTDFARKKNETVSVYLPAYAVANKRTLRANAQRTRSTLKERKIDVTLDTNLQVDVSLTDENLALDVEDLTRQVIAPSIGAIVRGYEEVVVDTMQSASYEVELAWDSNDPYGVLVDAGTALEDHAVPMSDRFLVVGSQLANDLRKSELLKRVDQSGSGATLRNGVIGDVAGFTVLTSQFMDRNAGFAYHRTAYTLCSRAPQVPDGVAWGNVQSSNGLAVRVMQHLTQDDDKDLLNVVYHDSWLGCGVVTDNGHIDANGKFVPSVDPDGVSEDDMLVRAVKLGVSASS